MDQITLPKRDPNAIKNLLVDTGQSLARDTASIGLTLEGIFKGKGFATGQTQTPESAGSASPVYRAVFGDQPTRSIQDNIAVSANAIRNSPIAKKLGLDKHAVPLAFGATVGNLMLDFAPVGGEKSVINQLVQTKSEEEATNLLKSIKVPEEDAQMFGKYFASLTKPDDVKQALALMKNQVGLKTLSEHVGNMGSALEKQFAPEPVRKNLQEFDAATQDAVSKITGAITGAAKTGRKELEQAMAEERASRAARGSAILASGTGKEAFAASKSALAGELASEKKAFEAPKIGEKEVTQLFNAIKSHPNFSYYEMINAGSGLMKVLDGQIPQQGELKLLEDAFGSDFTKAIIDKKGGISQLKDKIVGAIGYQRFFQTIFDTSSILKAAGPMTLTKPGSTFKASRALLDQVFSPENYKAWFDEIGKSPLATVRKESGLYIANPEKIAGGLSEQPDEFMNSMYHSKNPILRTIAQTSERAYTAYPNQMRVDVFDRMASQFIANGHDPATEKKLFKDLAEYVNVFTGRGASAASKQGTFTRWAKNNSDLLNTVFYASQQFIGRMKMLNPMWYAAQEPAVRAQSIKTMFQYIGTGAAIMELAHMNGAEVGLDPTSPNFGEIKIGNQRWDIWGGLRPIVVFATREALGKSTSSTGKVSDLTKPGYAGQSRLSVALDFMRSKLAPVPGLAWSLLDGGKDAVGKPVTISSTLSDMMTPLFAQDIGAAVKEFGPEAIFTVGGPAFLGVETPNYQAAGSTPSGTQSGGILPMEDTLKSSGTSSGGVLPMQ